METKLRIGTGYDAHPLVKKRKLFIGGVEIPFDKGLDGWSDAPPPWVTSAATSRPVSLGIRISPA